MNDNQILGAGTEHRPGPSGLATFVAFVSLLAGPYVILFLMAFMAMTADDLAAAGAVLTLGTKIVIGWLAVRDRKRGGRSGFGQLLVFACAFVPIITWLAMYWAARELARSGPAFHAVWIGTAIIGLGVLLAYAISFSPAAFAPAGGGQVVAPTAGVARPTRTPRPPTAKPPPAPTRRVPGRTPTRPRATSTPDCLSATLVRLRHVGMELCVYGEVWSVYESGEAFIVEFSDKSNALYLLSYDYYWPDMRPGDCVLAEGKIEQLGDNPVMVVQDLYLCV